MEGNGRKGILAPAPNHKLATTDTGVAHTHGRTRKKRGSNVWLLYLWNGRGTIFINGRAAPRVAGRSPENASKLERPSSHFTGLSLLPP